MKSKRALESAVETTLRHTNDSMRKAQKRALETDDESMQWKEQDKARNARILLRRYTIILF